MTRGAASWDRLQQGLGTLDTRPFGGADLPAHSEISGWLAPRYGFDEECDEEAELFLPRTVLRCEKRLLAAPRRPSLHRGRCLWYERNRLADLCNGDAGRKLHSYQMENYFNAEPRSSCQGKHVDRRHVCPWWFG